LVGAEDHSWKINLSVKKGSWFWWI